MKLFKSLIFIIFLCFIDIYSLNDLWNENFHRRILHHFQRNEYNNRKTELLYKLNQTNMNLHIWEIKHILESIQKHNNTQCLNKNIISKIGGGLYSNKCSLYYNNMNNDLQNICDSIGNRFIDGLKKISGETHLELTNTSFRCAVLSYYGKNAGFGWHYDTEPHNNWRTIYLLEQENNAGQFIYRSESGKNLGLGLNISQGLLFKGTQTYHSVYPNLNENNKRTVIGWQYTNDSNIVENSFCTNTRHLNWLEIFKIIFPNIFLITIGSLAINFILGNNTKSNWKYNILINLSIVFLSMYLPNQLPIWMGTGLNNGLISSLIYLLICWFSTFDFDFMTIMYCYYILTEMLLPNVGKSLNILG